MAPPSTEALRSCFEECTQLIKATNCAPLLVRFAWHDSGNYDKTFGTGGATGSIRFSKELAHGGNAGLTNALRLLEPIKEKYPDVGYADLFQMASAAAIKASGGPDIPMRYGRVDATREDEVPREGRLPDGAAPFGQSDGENPGEKSKDPSPSAHLRRVFYRMGLSDKEIVALSGAHALGRAYKDRSGLVTMVDTKYTREGPGSRGGMSWTKDWLKFDNSYFVLLKEAQEGEGDPELLRLVTDTVLLEDDKFKPYAQKYASDQEAFFRDYAEAHARLSECGSTFDPPGGIKMA
jgi:L-ascorbate peroxidase